MNYWFNEQQYFSKAAQVQGRLRLTTAQTEKDKIKVLPGRRTEAQKKITISKTNLRQELMINFQGSWQVTIKISNKKTLPQEDIQVDVFQHQEESRVTTWVIIMTCFSK